MTHENLLFERKHNHSSLSSSETTLYHICIVSRCWQKCFRYNI